LIYSLFISFVLDTKETNQRKIHGWLNARRLLRRLCLDGTQPKRNAFLTASPVLRVKGGGKTGMQVVLRCRGERLAIFFAKSEGFAIVFGFVLVTGTLEGFGWWVELLGVEHPVAGGGMPVFHGGSATDFPAIGFEVVEKLSGFQLGKTFNMKKSDYTGKRWRLHYLFFFLRNFFSFGLVEHS
jgi:hypothetical protein